MEKFISIIIPVYNEPDINITIDKIKSQDYSSLEILVIDGEESGRTINTIENKSVKKYISAQGRANQMNFGAEKASGEILLFLHADSILPTNALTKVNKIILSGYKVGCFNIKFQSKNYILREIISRTSSIRGRITRLPYGDQGHFFKKKYFDIIGGYAEIPIMEDIEIMTRIKHRKDKIFIIPDRIKTSTRRWEEEGMLYVMLRNPILSSLFLLGVPAEKLYKYYPRAKKYKDIKMEV